MKVFLGTAIFGFRFMTKGNGPLISSSSRNVFSMIVMSPGLHPHLLGGLLEAYTLFFLFTFLPATQKARKVYDLLLFFFMYIYL